MSRRISLLSGVLLCLASAASFGAVETMVTRVSQVVVTDRGLGGCMLALADNPQNVLPNCNATFVTLSCDGSIIAKDVARNLLENAQIAKALNRKVKVFIDDNQNANGFCLAFRIDLR